MLVVPEDGCFTHVGIKLFELDVKPKSYPVQAIDGKEETTSQAPSLAARVVSEKGFEKALKAAETKATASPHRRVS